MNYEWRAHDSGCLVQDVVVSEVEEASNKDLLDRAAETAIGANLRTATSEQRSQACIRPTPSQPYDDLRNLAHP